jgi:hypothetical protein
MTRFTQLLAVAALALGGAFLTTAAQASAANFNVSFAIKNADSTNSMIRVTDPLPSGVTGLIAPPSAISPGNYDPASSYATYSAPLPTPGHPASVSLAYANTNNLNDKCLFTIEVKYVSGSAPYVLHFSSDQTRCTVPADQSSATGQFTGSISTLAWNA